MAKKNSYALKDDREKPVTQEVDQQRYSVKELASYSKGLFSVKPEAVYGALYGQQLKEEYTIDEMRQLVDLFLRRKVR